MISLSDNDIKVIEFLIKNYSSRYTTREIGIKLKLSPAGAYKTLKKLEQNNLAIPEKLGTGLFFHLNYTNPSVIHLACFVFSLNEKDYPELKEHVRSIIKNSDSIIIINHHHDESIVKSIASKTFKEKITVISEEEFARKIMTKEKEIVELLKNAEILFGAEHIVKTLSRAIR